MAYLTSAILPILSLMTLLSENLVLWIIPLFYTFILIPLADLVVPKKIATVAKPEGDGIILLVSLGYLGLFLFGLFWLSDKSGIELIFKSISLGVCGGVIGINCAHELGHRPQKSYQVLAKVLLLTCFYMHFFTEHNKGHHRHVGTKEDPATSRYNETLYHFVPRTIVFTFISAFKIDKAQVLLFVGLEFLAALLVYVFLGVSSFKAYLISAGVAILLLEIVNYIEHYGLERKLSSNKYERVSPEHSWDSDYLFSSLHLFNLSLHSDHHCHVGKKFYELSPSARAPQMPTGYAGMMLLALIPPLWFRVMNPRINELLKAPQKIP